MQGAKASLAAAERKLEEVMEAALDEQLAHGLEDGDDLEDELQGTGYGIWDKGYGIQTALLRWQSSD
jgi:hypothetical protein